MVEAACAHGCKDLHSGSVDGDGWTGDNPISDRREISFWDLHASLPVDYSTRNNPNQLQSNQNVAFQEENVSDLVRKCIGEWPG